MRRPRRTPRPTAATRPRRPRRPRASRAGRAARRRTTELRLRVGLIVIAMILTVFAWRLVQVQGVDAKSYAAMARAAGATGIKTLELPATRGRILDRNGTPLADSVAGLMITADPTQTASHAEWIAKVLADKLHLDYFDVLAKLSKQTNDQGKKIHFVYIARRVPSVQAQEVLDAVSKKKYAGLYSASDPVRTYPAGDVAANLLGYIGDDPAKNAAGLERSFNKLLAGKSGEETYETGDKAGNRIPLGENSHVDPVDGKDLKLTIDRDVQWYSQRVLRTAVQSAKAESGAAVVVDTRTGEVLALADYPSFDSNDPGDSPQEDRGSRALTDTYEPGSVEKVLTASSLINDGLVTPATRFTVPAKLKVLDRWIGDWFPHDTIHLTLAGVIAKSSNIGTALAATQMDPPKLRDHLTRFGLGSPTGVGMPGEGSGYLVPRDEWNTLTRAQVAFGQGLSVNALQMATAVNTIANHGQRITPSLISGEATTSGGQTVGTDKAKRTQVVSPSAAKQTARMMELVTTQDVGTAPGAGIGGYRVSGKTGTAQEVGGKCKCYKDGGLAVSFAGFAPADNPRFTVYVVVKHPAEGASGGGTAGPVFRKILTYVLQKYAVAPTGTTPARMPIKWRANG